MKASFKVKLHLLELIIYLKNLPVFEPYSYLILIWDLLIIIIILFMFFWLPLKISFSLSSLNELFCIYNDGF